MDIKHLEYFIEVVNSKCNLSVASKKAGISQPALSAIIRNFEKEENIRLFERYKGRLRNLTPTGETFYRNALHLTEHYRNMLSDLRESAVQYRGKVKIGIPPLVLSVVFSNILPRMVLDNPNIEFEILELDAHELRKQLISKSLDFAVLPSSMEIGPDISNESMLVTSELTAFMSPDNPLVQSKKIYWDQLNGQTLAIFDSTFVIHHHLMDRFSALRIRPKICIMSSHWDFLLFSTKNTGLITILPSAISNIINTSDIAIAEKHFYDPIPWKVVLHQQRKSQYNPLEKYVLKLILDCFP